MAFLALETPSGLFKRPFRWRPLPTTRYTAGGASDRSSKETSQNWEGTSESRSRSSSMNFWDLRRYHIIREYVFQLNNISWQHLPLDACSLSRPTDLLVTLVSTDSSSVRFAGEELLQCQRCFLHKCLYNGGKCLLCFSFFLLLFVLTAEYSQIDICRRQLSLFHVDFVQNIKWSSRAL